MVFEDDAGFVEDFAERLQQYADELPADWGLAYLGGQHLFAGKHPPQRISDHVYRPYNVNRTHAFMVRGRENMKVLYRHLHWNEWQQRHHIDHHLGRLTQRRYQALVQGKNIDKESIAVYTPDRWLVGQLPTKSNICGRKWTQTRFFNDAKNADHSDAPFFAVLGPHRSGTSCVAMVMHHLGVHMGNELGGYEATGGGEAIGLANLCEKAMRFPAIDPKIPDGQLAKQLKAWIVTRKAEAIRDRTVAGGKYPHLCRFANHLYEALGNSLRIIAVDRPIEASIRSLQDRSSRQRFMEYDLDILAVRQGDGGRPMLFSPLMNGTRIWMHRGERKRIGETCWCDMVSNAFLARRDTIARVRWDDEIKTYEHWEFFYRASQIEHLQIAVALDCSVVHDHVAAKPYGALRARPKFRRLGLRKHGFDSLRYPGGGIVHA